MSSKSTSRKRKFEDTDPDVFPGSDEDLGDLGDGMTGQHDEKRTKRDRSGGGGLQTFTKYVCEKLEKEQEMSNTDIAEKLVREHTTGDAKKNDNIRRRVYDALSVIQAIGLAEKQGKTYRWIGRPNLPSVTNPLPISGKLTKALTDKRNVLIRLIHRMVGLEYIRLLNSSRNDSHSGTTDLSRGRSSMVKSGSNGGVDSRNADELGEFQLPILVLSTNSSSRMLMETDGANKETYIKINQTYKLKSSDSILTELGYDDFSKLDRSVANSLLQIFIAAKIPKDIIEEALNITISETDFNTISTIYNESAQLPIPQPIYRSETEPMSPGMSSRGLDAIVSAAQRLESSSLRLPSVSQNESSPI